MQNTLSLNKIISLFYSLSMNNPMVNEFDFGPVWNISKKNRRFPLVYLEPSSAVGVKSESTSSSMRTFIYSYNLYVFDKIIKGDDNYNELLSDTQYIIQSLIAQIDQHPYYVDLELMINSDINWEPVQEAQDDNVNGWVANISFKVPNRLTPCTTGQLPLLTWETQFGTASVEYRLIGPQGPTGADGLQGPTGNDGPQGFQGPTGNDGPQGFQGPVSPAGLNWMGLWSSSDTYVLNDTVGYASASWFCFTSSVGPSVVAPNTDITHWALLAAQGAPGQQGSVGPIGLTGNQGPIGPTGNDGSQGSVGPIGLTGNQGPIGPTGNIGNTGSMLSEITTTTTYVTSVTFSSAVADPTNRVVYNITSQSGALLLNFTGSWTQSQILMVRLRDNGSASTLSYSSGFTYGTSLVPPTTTTVNKLQYFGFLYNAQTAKMDFVSYLLI